MVRSQSSSGDDAVHMDMVGKLLVPGMEHLDDPGSGSKVFFIRRQLKEGLCTATVQQTVEELLVTVDQWVEFVGQGEDHMEVGSVYHLSPALVHPDLFIDSPAVWTAAVPAGIVVDPGIAAVGTAAYMIAKISCLTGKDGCGRLFLDY